MNILNTNTDAYFYDYINSISNDKICYLVPNHITILNFIFSLYIAYSICKKKYNLSILLLFMFIRIILDCLDGAVARKCNKTSELGKYLDVFSDTTFHILLTIILYINIKPKYKWIKNIIPFIIMFIIYSGYSCLYYDYEIFKTRFGTFIYNNTILLILIEFYIYYQLI